MADFMPQEANTVILFLPNLVILIFPSQSERVNRHSSGVAIRKSAICICLQSLNVERKETTAS